MTNADEPLIPAMPPKVVRCTHCRALHLGWEDGEPVSPGELVDPAVARERARIVEALREAAHGGNRGQPGSFWVGWRAAARAIEQATVSPALVPAEDAGVAALTASLVEAECEIEGLRDALNKIADLDVVDDSDADRMREIASEALPWRPGRDDPR